MKSISKAATRIILTPDSLGTGSTELVIEGTANRSMTLTYEKPPQALENLIAACNRIFEAGLEEANKQL